MGESEEENSLQTKPAIAVRFTAKSGGYPGDGKSEEQIEKAWEIFRPSFEEGSRIFLPNQSVYEILFNVGEGALVDCSLHN